MAFDLRRAERRGAVFEQSHVAGGGRCPARAQDEVQHPVQAPGGTLAETIGDLLAHRLHKPADVRWTIRSEFAQRASRNRGNTVEDHISVARVLERQPKQALPRIVLTFAPGLH